MSSRHNGTTEDASAFRAMSCAAEEAYLRATPVAGRGAGARARAQGGISGDGLHPVQGVQLLYEACMTRLLSKCVYFFWVSWFVFSNLFIPGRSCIWRCRCLPAVRSAVEKEGGFRSAEARVPGGWWGRRSKIMGGVRRSLRVVCCLPRCFPFFIIVFYSLCPPVNNSSFLKVARTVLFEMDWWTKK